MAEFDQKGFQIEVGILLAIKRKARGYTQHDLATAIGLKRATYANMEKGRQRVPVDVLWRVAIMLGVQLADLVPKRDRGHVDRAQLAVPLRGVFPENTTSMGAFDTAILPNLFPMRS